VSSPSTDRRTRVCFVLLVVGCVTVLPKAQRIPETTVKAALISRFSDFVAWPNSASPGNESLTVCLSPAHPFGNGVAAAVRNVRGHGRTTVVREIGRREPIDACHVLYLAPQDREMLDRARRMPILTIGDEPGFCALGGIINLRVVDGRVRFDVGLASARRVGLTIDSQLLRLAVAVHGGRP
jgi:hypothetical protein